MQMLFDFVPSALIFFMHVFFHIIDLFLHIHGFLLLLFWHFLTLDHFIYTLMIEAYLQKQLRKKTYVDDKNLVVIVEM